MNVFYNVYPVWSDADGIYHASMDAVPLPAGGARRERVNGFLAAEARAFERHIAAAPEQWLAVFHPIWPDLETSADRAAPAADRAPAADAAHAREAMR